MDHQIRFTAEKIKQRIQLIEPLVYRRRQPITSFRYSTLADSLESPP